MSNEAQSTSGKLTFGNLCGIRTKGVSYDEIIIPHELSLAGAIGGALALADRLPADDPLVLKIRAMAERALEELRVGQSPEKTQ